MAATPAGVKAMGFDYASALVASLQSELPALKVGRASEALVGLKVVVAGGSVAGLAAAACLKKAGFRDVKVYEKEAALGRAGAGVGLDDATAAILKGLGIIIDVAPTRYVEERTSDRLLQRQPYPYWSTRYADLREGLLRACCDADVDVTFRRRVVAAAARQHEDEAASFGKVATAWDVVTDQGEMTVREEEEEADLLVVADGPRSTFRETPLRYAGYVAWRGTVARDALSPEARAALERELPLLGNCLFFLHSRHCHGVLYDMGRGVLNWLVYENSAEPRAGDQRRKTTSGLSLKEELPFFNGGVFSLDRWGPGFGSVLRETKREDIFRTDVYDLEKPLPTLFRDDKDKDDDKDDDKDVKDKDMAMVFVGDAAHATTPHVAKGSNMAIHDAFALAKAAETAATRREWLEAYSALRLGETSNTVAFSRHVGKLRNGLLPKCRSPRNQYEFVEQILRDPTLEPRTLPSSKVFDAVWDFSLRRCFDGQVPPPSFFYLVKHRPLAVRGPVRLARETTRLAAMATFYGTVLGLDRKSLQSSGGRVSFALGDGLVLDVVEVAGIIGENTNNAQPRVVKNDDDDDQQRKGNTITLAVDDITLARTRLENHGITVRSCSNDEDHQFSGRTADQTTILRCRDPEGYGVDIGHFPSAFPPHRAEREFEITDDILIPELPPLPAAPLEEEEEDEEAPRHSAT